MKGHSLAVCGGETAQVLLVAPLQAASGETSRSHHHSCSSPCLSCWPSPLETLLTLDAWERGAVWDVIPGHEKQHVELVLSSSLATLLYGAEVVLQNQPGPGRWKASFQWEWMWKWELLEEELRKQRRQKEILRTASLTRAPVGKGQVSDQN